MGRDDEDAALAHQQELEHEQYGLLEPGDEDRSRPGQADYRQAIQGEFQRPAQPVVIVVVAKHEPPLKARTIRAVLQTGGDVVLPLISYRGACLDGVQHGRGSLCVLQKIAGIQSRGDLAHQLMQRLFERQRGISYRGAQLGQRLFDGTGKSDVAIPAGVLGAVFAGFVPKSLNSRFRQHGLGDVVLLGHENSSLLIGVPALRAMASSTSRNSAGVASRMRVLSLPPTMAIIPMRRAFS